MHERALHRRAVEAVGWGLPAVNYDLMYQAMVRETGGAFNQIVYWSRPLDWKNQTLTPNPDTVYFMPFINTQAAGPVVLELPPADGGSITGTVMDCWQAALEDVGPAGVDKGAGGKYLILPPGAAAPAPAGYLALPSDTYQGYALLRSNLRSGSAADVRGRRVRSADQALPPRAGGRPPPTVFVDAAGVLFDSTIPYDLRFFRSLARMVQEEPWLPRDKVMIDLLKSLGIEKGKPFRPDPRTEALLGAAAREAHAWLESRYETAFAPFYAGSQWGVPALPEFVATMATFFETPEAYAVDARGLVYSYAFFSPKHTGAGQWYLMTIKDEAGRALDGGRTYRLRVPANAPVRLYWSATAYDRATHALIRDLPWASRASHTPELRPNDDGSVDLAFGPAAPVGREANWVPTRAGGAFEVLVRFYGPEPPLFDKSWRLPDLERVD